MAVKTYSLKNDGETRLSPHFKVKEFKCKDGSDKILISTEKIEMLEKLRSNYNITKASIISGYRTEAYNKSIGGSSGSQHCKGTASDVRFYIGTKIADSKYVCCLAQDLGFKGIAYINSTSVHLDTRTSGSYRGDERYGFSNNVGGDFYKYFKLTKEQVNKYFGIVTEQPKPVEEPKPVEPPKEEPKQEEPTEPPIEEPKEDTPKNDENKPDSEQTHEEVQTPTKDTNNVSDGSNTEKTSILVQLFKLIINFIKEMFKK